MSKNTILSTIRKNKATSVKLPEIPSFALEDKNDTELFVLNLGKAGGGLIMAQDMTLEELVQQKFTEAKNIVSVYDAYEGNQNISAFNTPHELQNIDLAIVTGHFGVAENGAVWINTANLVHRALPFITENLIIVLKKDSIVANMHQAYYKIEGTESKFGVFISGPSKTADIEQSLVIGAHGAKSLYVYYV